MAGPLSERVERELEDLARRYGEPVRVDAAIDDAFDDPLRRVDRIGEVCFVIRRPNGKALLSIKTTYPRGAHRLPTGGISPGERVEDALLREAREETGLDVALRRFLARITYRPRAGGPPIFHTFAFLLDELGGTLGALDLEEDIEEYVEVAPGDLPGVAERLEGQSGAWRDWGRFRAVVHRAVHEALVTIEAKEAHGEKETQHRPDQQPQ